MSYRFIVITFHLVVFYSCLAHPPDYWMAYFKSNPIPMMMTITQNRMGTNYIRGFPRGVLGTNLFPVLTEQGDGVTHGIHFWQDYLTRNSLPEVSITEDFLKFYSYTIAYFCEQSDKTEWGCCKNGIKDPSCSQVPQKAKEVASLLIDPEQSLPLIFLYHWCINAWQMIRSTNTSQKIIDQTLTYCPNPCHGSPCRSVKHAINVTSCEVIGSFEDDYKCTCDRRHEWDPHLLICTPKHPCLDEVFPPCVAENTAACLAKNAEEVLCVCKDEFMGVDCSLPRDACFERVNKSAPNGNTNCQVQFGNRCTPISGTDYYTCTCMHAYVPSLAITEDNCLGRFDPCKAQFVDKTANTEIDDDIGETDVTNKRSVKESQHERSALSRHRALVCFNGGQCISSSDMTRATCVCPLSSDGSMLFMGINCEIAIGTWSMWSPLSPCLPSDCGQSRYRWRRRRCLNTTSAKDLVNLNHVSPEEYARINPKFTPNIRCPGTSEEVISCEQMEPCAVLRLPGKLREEIFDYNSLFYFGYVTLAEVVFSVLVWYVFASPVMAYMHRRRTRKPVETIQ